MGGSLVFRITWKKSLGCSIFRNSQLRKIVGHKREKTTGDWKKLHNEEL
jgi:hypothetical protein